MTIKVFDFFSGCGGASRGFREAGLDIVFALDHDPDARSTFLANFPSADFVLTDIRNVSPARARELVAKTRPSLVLFCGCAPCQPFTKQNTKRIHPDKDERVPLLAHFASLVRAARPDVVFVENVPGLQRLTQATQPFGGFIHSLTLAGYHFDYKPVSLMKYGVPQTRRRLILLASRHGPIFLPPTTYGPGTDRPYETVRGWIGDLPPIRAGEAHPTILNHQAAALSGRNLARIRATPEGGGHQHWPSCLRLPCHSRMRGYSDVYGRMSWDRPASGLTTRCISYSNGRFGHPEQDRAISIREAACLQTFPRDFVFKGSPTSMSRQIGNAVPVRLTRLIGERAVSHLMDVRTLQP